MSSFLFDANALVYWVYPGSPHHDQVNGFLDVVLSERSAIYALSSSLNEIYYALHSHYMSEADARDSIRDIAGLFDLVDLTGPLVHASLDSDDPDYEDGLIRAAAEFLQVDAIITYDRSAFRSSFIPKLTTGEAIKIFSGKR